MRERTKSNKFQEKNKPGAQHHLNNNTKGSLFLFFFSSSLASTFTHLNKTSTPSPGTCTLCTWNFNQQELGQRGNYILSESTYSTQIHFQFSHNFLWMLATGYVLTLSTCISNLKIIENSYFYKIIFLYCFNTHWVINIVSYIQFQWQLAKALNIQCFTFTPKLHSLWLYGKVIEISNRTNSLFLEIFRQINTWGL